MGLTSSIDLAEILFTLFWVFFAFLVLYLHRESKREGYPMEPTGTGTTVPQGFPATPGSKKYLMPHGMGKITVPRTDVARELPARPASSARGAPLIPTGNPMLDAIGPGTYAQRRDIPDFNMHGQPKIVPISVAQGFHVDHRDPDPRGMPVFGADDVQAGVVSELWVDIVEPLIAYYEVALDEQFGGRKVLLPVPFARFNRWQGNVRVKAIYSHQFADVPALASNQQITALEEDKVCAYYGAGTLYADDQRQEPFI
jgi:photosynthetic reaction center H subunit